MNYMALYPRNTDDGLTLYHKQRPASSFSYSLQVGEGFDQMSLILDDEAVIMGRVWARGRVLGDLHRHNDLDIFQHSSDSVCLHALLLLTPQFSCY